MGERSQVFVRIRVKDTPKSRSFSESVFVATHHQWSYGERMISRCRGIIEWLNTNKQYACLIADKQEELRRVIDTNWDMRSVVMGADLIKWSVSDWVNGYVNEIDKLDVFNTDTNHGHIYIDLTAYTSPKYQDMAKVKYAFCEYKGKPVMSVDRFADFDMGNDNQYREEKEPIRRWFTPNEYHSTNMENWANIISYTSDNINYINENATLMTEKEKAEFESWGKDFVKELALKELPIKKNEENNG